MFQHNIVHAFISGFHDIIKSTSCFQTKRISHLPSLQVVKINTCVHVRSTIWKQSLFLAVWSCSSTLPVDKLSLTRESSHKTCKCLASQLAPCLCGVQNISFSFKEEFGFSLPSLTFYLFVPNRRDLGGGLNGGQRYIVLGGAKISYSCPVLKIFSLRRN